MGVQTAEIVFEKNEIHIKSGVVQVFRFDIIVPYRLII